MGRVRDPQSPEMNISPKAILDFSAYRHQVGRYERQRMIWLVRIVLEKDTGRAFAISSLLPGIMSRFLFLEEFSGAGTL
jgi:hypothetical protein